MNSLILRKSLGLGLCLRFICLRMENWWRGFRGQRLGRWGRLWRRIWVNKASGSASRVAGRVYLSIVWVYLSRTAIKSRELESSSAKLDIGGLVVGWVATNGSPLLYIFVFLPKLYLGRWWNPFFLFATLVCWLVKRRIDWIGTTILISSV